MPKKYFLIILSLILVISPLTSSAEEAPQNIKDATVNLYCRIKIGGKTMSTTGSGVIIDNRGVILTNAHVGQFFLLAGKNDKSKGNCYVRAGSPAVAQYEASLLYISPNWISTYTNSVSKKTEKVGTGERDFALLYITGAKNKSTLLNFKSLPLANLLNIQSLKEGEMVGIAGYPAENLNFDKVKSKLTLAYATSTITSIRSFIKPQADLLVLAPSTAAKSGVSGGPILNQASEVIALATALENNEKNKKTRSLRAITLAHVDRVIRTETGLPLTTLIQGDLATRAKLTTLFFTPAVRATLEKTLRRSR
ncbi:MAG: trypsin-like peptidase domain-containing protein [Candidatus Pacebacteria bacterium]|nr:trypsin-like peptidase domain-containing protein [Candidatus Paceibacterota bacterium]